MKVWVVMDQLATDDDGDYDVDLVAVHLSQEGANANLTPDGSAGLKFTSPRYRYVVETDTRD